MKSTRRKFWKKSGTFINRFPISVYVKCPYREDLEADAQKAEEQAKAVAFGEHRRKRNRRNGGIGIDSDDSEDEDGIHPHRLKKRKKEREDITGLGKMRRCLGCLRLLTRPV